MSRSPQMEQRPPAIGRIAPRHSSHTGSREMFIKGAPQRRQSEGNNVAKRPAAIPLAQETHGLSCATSVVPVARIGVPLLLKTILRHPAAATRAPTGRIFFSIAAREAGSNEVSHSRRYVGHDLIEARPLSNRISVFRTFMHLEHSWPAYPV